jgi:transcriptional regulator with XRE-family HTH domain
MNKLFNLNPIAQARWNRESLRSYTGRLAEFHCVGVGDLINEVIWPDVCTHTVAARRADGCRVFKLVDGAGQTASDWVASLARLTGRDDLGRLTVLPAGGALRFDGSCRHTGARCIECLREAADANRPTYEPLCWSLSDYTVCIKHQVLLTCTCVMCGAQGDSLMRANARVGCCGKCGAWIGGERFESLACIEDSRYAIAASETISDLVGCLDEPVLSRVDGAALYEYAAKIAFDGNYAEMARTIGIAKSTLSTILAKRTRPDVRHAVALSLATGVPIKRLLLGSETKRRVSSIHLRESVRPPKKTKRARRAPVDKVTVEKKLRHALHWKKAASLTAISNELNSSPRVLKTHCPDLCKAIVKRYLAQKRLDAETSHAQTCEWIATAVKTCILGGDFPSSRRVSECIGPKLMEDRYRDVYQENLRKLGLLGQGRQPSQVVNRLLDRAKMTLSEEEIQWDACA